MPAKGTTPRRTIGTAVVLVAVVLLAGCTDGGGGATSSTRPDLDAALRAAAWAGDVDEARRLVARGADVNAEDDTQQSAYLVATSEGHLELLELALASGADVDAKDSWNGTGLIRAAERGHHLVVGRLVRAGIDRDHVNRIGYQAVHEAVWFGADEADELATVQVLVAGGVQLDRPSGQEGLTPLEMARQRGFRSLERVLVAAERHRPSRDADAALLAAARDGEADDVALALRDGADLEARDAGGRTALLLAASGDHVEAARVLVALGADPDAVDDQQDTPWLVNRLGWTALLEAVVLGDGGQRHQEVVRILLDAGADPTIGDRDGVTALEHAERLGHDEIAATLRAVR